MLVPGLRRIEITRATCEDLKYDESLDQYQFRPFGKGKTGTSDAFMVVPKALYEILHEYLSDREALNPDNSLFISMSNNSKGKRITSKSVSWMTKSYLRFIGLDSLKITTHSCRHTAVTLALMTKDSDGNILTLREVQHFARHANQSTTEIYAHEQEEQNSKV